MAEKRGPGNPTWQKDGASPNPKGRPPSGPRKVIDWLSAAFRSDTWTNVLSGQGTSTYDRRMSAYFVSDYISEEQGRELYRGDDLCARIVEAIVNLALSKEFSLRVPEDAEDNDENYGTELIKKVHEHWKRLDVINVLRDAWCAERACNGSVIVLGADDGAQDLTEPLVLDRVKSFEWLTVLEPREVSPLTWYTNAKAPKFGKVETYLLNPIVTGWSKAGTQLTATNVAIHESRLIVLEGIKVSRTNQWGTSNGFGDNIFTRIFRVLNDFNAGFSSAGRLVSEFATPIFKIKNLAQTIEQDNKELFQARMQSLALAISTHRAALIDMDEEFKREQVPVTGLPELLELMLRRVAGAADCPVSIFWGESPGGLNASGAQGDQVKMWYARGETARMQKVLPWLHRITEIIFAVNGGAPDEWEICCEPFSQPSAKESADTNKVKTDDASALFDRGVLSAEEMRRSPELDLVKRHGIVVDDEPDDLEPGAADVEAFKNGTQPPLAVDPNNPTAAPVDPNAPAGGVSTELAKEAFNGAQVSALIEVVTSVASGLISRESGQQMLMLAFQLDPQEAVALLGPPGFEPKSPEPAPGAFGGGFPPKVASPEGAPVKVEAKEAPAPNEDTYYKPINDRLDSLDRLLRDVLANRV